MSSGEKSLGSADKNSSADHSDDVDMKQFDKLFLELVTESTASEDRKLDDAMKWFKKASMNQVEFCILPDT